MHRMFILVGFLFGTEIYCMPHIFRFSYKVWNRRSSPSEWSVHVTASPTGSKSLLCKIIGRSFNLFILQNPCHLHRSVSLNDKLINTSYHCGSLFINNPMVWVIRVFLVPVNCVACQMFSIHSLIMKYGFDFPAGITYIPLIHNVKKWGKFVTAIV